MSDHHLSHYKTSRLQSSTITKSCPELACYNVRRHFDVILSGRASRMPTLSIAEMTINNVGRQWQVTCRRFKKPPALNQ